MNFIVNWTLPILSAEYYEEMIMKSGTKSQLQTYIVKVETFYVKINSIHVKVNLPVCETSCI